MGLGQLKEKEACIDNSLIFIPDIFDDIRYQNFGTGFFLKTAINKNPSTIRQ
jgi:hypothetical protein